MYSDSLCKYISTFGNDQPADARWVPPPRDLSLGKIPSFHHVPAATGPPVPPCTSRMSIVMPSSYILKPS